MQRKTATAVSQKHAHYLLPGMLNKRRYSLKKILNRYMGLPFSQHQPSLCLQDLCEAGLEEAFIQMLKVLQLNGKSKPQQAEPVAIEVRGVAIAFDEEVSFSHYRYLSLQSPVYAMPLLPRLQHYEAYCKQYVPQPNAEASPDVERALRKRALQDFMQDLMPAVHHMPLIRLSVYDHFFDGHERCSLGNILEADSERFYLPIADYISSELDRVDQLFLTDY